MIENDFVKPSLTKLLEGIFFGDTTLFNSFVAQSIKNMRNAISMHYE